MKYYSGKLNKGIFSKRKLNIAEFHSEMNKLKTENNNGIKAINYLCSITESTRVLFRNKIIPKPLCVIPNHSQMKIKFIIISLLFLIGTSCISNEKNADSKQRIKIEWVENLKGDFSFNKKWNYGDGIYRNQNGELRLDSGMVPLEIEEIINRMKDEKGEIYKDSLSKYYKVIDTTHIFHSIKSNGNYYHMEFKKMENDEIKGETINNISGYSHLHIKLKNDYCYAWIDYKSVSDKGNHIFNLKNGRILIDKSLFKKGIIKTEFDFNFKNTLDLNEKLSRKGKIYSYIKTE